MKTTIEQTYADLAPKVNGLSWFIGSGRANYKDTEAQTMLGTYSCRKMNDGRWTLWKSERLLVEEPFETLEAAKAAAQADYERRILSALTLAPVTPAQAAEVLDPVAGKIAQIMNVPDCSNDLVHHELQAALKAIAEDG